MGREKMSREKKGVAEKEKEEGKRTVLREDKTLINNRRHP